MERLEPVPSRRVVLVPGSPDDTPRSIQDRSCASNRFSVLAESDAEDGHLQHHVGPPPPTADEGDIENDDTASLVGQHRTGLESVVGEDVIPEGEEFTFPARPEQFQTVDRTVSDARDVRVSPRGSDHAHDVGNESDTDSMEFEVEGSMTSGDEEEVVPSFSVCDAQC